MNLLLNKLLKLFFCFLLLASCSGMTSSLEEIKDNEGKNPTFKSEKRIYKNIVFEGISYIPNFDPKDLELTPYYNTDDSPNITEVYYTVNKDTVLSPDIKKFIENFATELANKSCNYNNPKVTTSLEGPREWMKKKLYKTSGKTPIYYYSGACRI